MTKDSSKIDRHNLLIILSNYLAQKNLVKDKRSSG